MSQCCYRKIELIGVETVVNLTNKRLYYHLLW